MWGKIFGTDKAVDNILDKDDGLLRRFGGWIDDFSHTEAEQVEANAVKREWGLRQLQALEPFKIVQRILAFASTLLWIIVGINVLVAIWLEALGIVSAKQDMLDFAFSDYVFWPVLTVYALYFSGGVVESFKSRKSNK